MNLSKRGAEFIGLHEGFRAKAYKDPVGIVTIGYGFTWRSHAFKRWWGEHRQSQFDLSSTITRSEADDVLILLMEQEYGKAVNDFLGKAVPQHVYDAMCSAVFNLGPGALKWKWAAACKAGNYADAAAKLRVTGTTAGGKKLPGLVRRRSEEALLIEKGIYTGVKAAQQAVSEPFHAPPDYVSPKPKPASTGFWSWLMRIFGRSTKETR